MNEFVELLQLVCGFLLIGGALAGATWLLWVASVQAYAFTRERLAQARIVEANANQVGANVALVRPDVNGLLPIHRDAVEQSTAAILALMAERFDSLRPPQPVPQSITYSPHYAAQVRNQMEGAQPLQEPQVITAMPTFLPLLNSNRLGDGQFLLGCDLETGQEITGSWRELYSTALGGLSGTGKSTTARFLLCQAALNGCKFVVLDPHAGAGDDSLAATLAPLTAAMLCEPASSDQHEC